MEGHLKVYRSFFKHWLWEEDRVYSKPEAFLDLLQFAAFAPTKRVVQGKLISLEVGELVASERFLETRWQWSRTKVRRFLGILIEDQMLDRRKDHGETILTLCNYSELSGSDSAKRTSKEPAKNQQRTSEEPNKKKDKNFKEGEEEESLFSESELPTSEIIYQAYPRKVGKPQAISAINKALKIISPNELLSLTEAYYKARTDRSGKCLPFTPNPSTWFNQRRFSDDPETWGAESYRRDSGKSSGPSGKTNSGSTYGRRKDQGEFGEF